MPPRLPPSDEGRSHSFSGRSRGHRRSWSGPIRARHGAWLAVLVSLGLFLVGQFPRDSPLVPALHIDLPSIRGPEAGGSVAVREPRIYRLGGPKQARQGGVLTIAGNAAKGVTGNVQIEVHWNAQPWQTVSSGPLGERGSYRAEIPLFQAGMLNIRVLLPNGDQARGSVRVMPQP